MSMSVSFPLSHPTTPPFLSLVRCWVLIYSVFALLADQQQHCWHFTMFIQIVNVHIKLQVDHSCVLGNNFLIMSILEACSKLNYHKLMKLWSLLTESLVWYHHVTVSAVIKFSHNELSVMYFLRSLKCNHYATSVSWNSKNTQIGFPHCT